MEYSGGKPEALIGKLSRLADGEVTAIAEGPAGIDATGTGNPVDAAADRGASAECDSSSEPDFVQTAAGVERVTDPHRDTAQRNCVTGGQREIPVGVAADRDADPHLAPWDRTAHENQREAGLTEVGTPRRALPLPPAGRQRETRGHILERGHRSRIEVALTVEQPEGPAGSPGGGGQRTARQPETAHAEDG